jgi:phosphatidylglycerophosphatase A
MTRPTIIKKETISALDRFAYALATGLGAGFAPVAPGTFGAIEGVVVFLGFVALGGSLSLSPRWSFTLLAIVNVVLFAVGVWASNRACEISGSKDPSQIVIDEVSGQLIGLTPLAGSVSVEGVIAAFVLFRLFDILKPYPIRKLEALPAGFGVMSDDALAGVYAAAIVWAALLWRLI